MPPSPGTPTPGGTAAAAESFAPPSSTSTNKAAGAKDWHRQVAAHDRKMTAAYQSGRTGMPADPDYGDDELAAHSSGAEEAAQPAASPPASTPRPAASSGSTPAGVGGKITSQGAPLLLGMIGYCLAVNWVRWGWPGVTGWVSAKFWNTPSGRFAGPAAKTPAATSGTEPNSTGNKTAPGPPSADNHGPYSGNGIYGRGGK